MSNATNWNLIAPGAPEAEKHRQGERQGEIDIGEAVKLVLQVGRVQIPEAGPEVDKPSQALNYIQAGMLDEKRESFAAFLAEILNFTEANEYGFLIGVDGRMHVGVEPGGGVAVVADPEFEPEVVAQRNGSMKGAVVADLPRKESGYQSDDNKQSRGKPERAVLRDSRRMRCLRFSRRIRRLEKRVDGPSGENRTKSESGGVC